MVTPTGEGLYDFLIVSTGLVTDTKLRPELAPVSDAIATWADRYSPAHEDERNPLVDAHPYLGPGFEFQEKVGGLGCGRWGSRVAVRSLGRWVGPPTLHVCVCTPHVRTDSRRRRRTTVVMMQSTCRTRTRPPSPALPA